MEGGAGRDQSCVWRVLIQDGAWQRVSEGTRESEGRKLPEPCVRTQPCSFQMRGPQVLSPPPRKGPTPPPCDPCPFTPLRTLLHCPPIPEGRVNQPQLLSSPTCFHSPPGTSLNLAFPWVSSEFPPILLGPLRTSQPSPRLSATTATLALTFDPQPAFLLLAHIPQASTPPSHCWFQVPRSPHPCPASPGLATQPHKS